MGTLGTNAVSININKDVEKYTEESILQALEMIGLKAESYAKVEITNNGSVDTGLLRNSIAHAVTVKEHKVYIGSNVYYAPYVELGHHQTPGRFVPQIGKRLKASWVQPKPFIKPAVMEHIEEYKQILENTLQAKFGNSH